MYGYGRTIDQTHTKSTGFHCCGGDDANCLLFIFEVDVVLLLFVGDDFILNDTSGIIG